MVPPPAACKNERSQAQLIEKKKWKKTLTTSVPGKRKGRETAAHKLENRVSTRAHAQTKAGVPAGVTTRGKRCRMS